MVLNFLERYLARQIELGRLRPHDPRAAARAFMGMLVVYAVGREIFPTVGPASQRRRLWQRSHEDLPPGPDGSFGVVQARSG